METKEFEKIKKKFALNNSYFKNRRPQDPATPFECWMYLVQHGELPYKEEVHQNWIYKCFVEHQKKAGVVNDQYFTPPHVAEEMVSVFSKHANITWDMYVLDAFCGYSDFWWIFYQKTIPYGYFLGFDIDQSLIDFAVEKNSFLPDFFPKFLKQNYHDLNLADFNHTTRGNGCNVISNPPYEVKLLTKFLSDLPIMLSNKNNIAVLLLPQGFIHKKTKAIQEAMSKFEVIVENRYDSKTFAHTRVLTEIVVLKLKK